ncbi:hypothetical protein TSUD_282680 [Trifolium subterraneum]|uniref:Ubiquitin-like protease family profile domain-containing protein n=1 Tax=Trifolium subterraneum TaxID=3900 RepID=A0A2Z6NVY8_TRISU|nr:hypothetical protein TSUD_282680 [Trifolium subterraneum]
MTSHKNTKDLGCIVPKLEAKFTCKPTYDMILAKRQPQVCAYLFQKRSDAKLMAEILVVSGELEATRADLQCLIPPRVISDLAAKRITCIQVEQQQFTDRQAVWCLPPSFVIYVPLKSVDGHWFLMIVHLKNEVIYHLDTYCPGGCAAYKHLYIKKVMKENEVRMTTAANILLGDHNALRDEVIRKTETFINKMVDVKPIKLDED